MTRRRRAVAAARSICSATLLAVVLCLTAALPMGLSGSGDGSAPSGSRLGVARAAEAVTAFRVVGYGSQTVGGAGGMRRLVTNLRDSGPGSLRAALEARGRRIVIFRVSGTIRLQSPIKINDPFLTVRGDRAPGSGITLRGDAVVIGAHDVILRHLRLRPGDQSDIPSETDALTINGNRSAVYNVVIDHVSMVWGPDIGGLAVLGNVSNVTIQNSIMGEGLYLSAHPEGTRAHGGHSTAANVTQMSSGEQPPHQLTFWRNLFTTSDSRMPRLQGARCVDLVNNVIYNWGIQAATGNPRSLNLLGNVFRRGPRTERLEIWHSQTSPVAPRLFTDSVFQQGNVTSGFRFKRGGAPRVFASTARCGGSSVSRLAASVAYTAVLTGAGATLPVRDVVDRRVIHNVRNREGRFFNGAGLPAPNPYWP